MRNSFIAALLMLVGCSRVSRESTELTLRRPVRNFTVDIAGNKFVGESVWGMSVIDEQGKSDWLRISATLDAPPSEESMAREVRMDVPLDLLGEWNGTEMHVAYSYARYSDATSLGVARVLSASTKAWQRPTVTGDDPAPEQGDPAKDEDAPPSPSNGEMPGDYIDGMERYVVRAVDLTYNSDGTKIGGTIALQSDNGQLPGEFDPELDLTLNVEGIVNSFECSSAQGFSTAETGVEVLRPNESMDALCLTRFHLK